jgi:hypothetical protein
MRSKEKISNGCVYFSAYVDEHGNSIERTKHDFPYSYDGYITWRGGENKEANGTIYSDRLLQQDYQKYNLLSKKHFGNDGQSFSNRSSEQIESFLRDWCDAPELKLIFVMEYCNVSSGYPLWRFEYNTNKK